MRDRRMKGFQNALRFHKMLVDAGGHVVAGGNTNATKTPGLNLHHEMQIFAEAGFTPMQIIQSATKWAAEMINKQDQVGTIGVGKFADVLIVNADPLQSVNNLEKVDTVVLDGKVVDRTFHSWYSTPFLSIANGGSPTVDGLPWVAAMKSVFSRRGTEEGAAPRPAAGLPNPAPGSAARDRNHRSGDGHRGRPGVNRDAQRNQLRAEVRGVLSTADRFPTRRRTQPNFRSRWMPISCELPGDSTSS